MSMECTGYLLEIRASSCCKLESSTRGVARRASCVQKPPARSICLIDASAVKLGFYWNKVGKRQAGKNPRTARGTLMIIAEAKLYLRFIVGMGEGDEMAHQGINHAGRSVSIVVTPHRVFKCSSDRSRLLSRQESSSFAVAFPNYIWGATRARLPP